MYRLFEYIIEIFGWVKIVASPLLIGGIIGVIIYVNQPNFFGLSIGIFFTSFGLTIGIIWANRVWKREGTNKFLSGIMATPDLDEKKNTMDEKMD